MIQKLENKKIKKYSKPAKRGQRIKIIHNSYSRIDSYADSFLLASREFDDGNCW